ncbi:REP-associated tyrosine transposase [Desulfonema magnum]|uniref:REP-associated tyrosine transposase n=1 Tax=Desulfonema magnum TaxID=45655 RepID=UPI001A9AA252|nr:transposase [Desulfonema magnum]
MQKCNFCTPDSPLAKIKFLHSGFAACKNVIFALRTRCLQKYNFCTPDTVFYTAEEKMLKRYIHTPAHLFIDDTSYFITGAIYRKRPLLNSPSLKLGLFELFQGYFDKHGWELHHWVILDNHYHLIGRSRKGKDLSAIMRNVHILSAKEIHKATCCEKPVWWNYWDYCPRNEKEHMTRANYLLFNPVRHGYVRSLHDYPFSGFHKLYTEHGREALVRQFREYPDYKSLVLHEAMEDDF